MYSNILPTDRVRLMGVIDPDNAATGTYTTDWVSMADFRNAMALVSAGELGASATLDAKVEEAEDDSGTNSQDLGKSITQLTQGGTDESDRQAFINVRDDELTDGYTHIRLSITVGTASSDIAGYLFGFDARYEPETDATTVAEIVS